MKGILCGSHTNLLYETKLDTKVKQESETEKNNTLRQGKMNTVEMRRFSHK